MSDSPTVGFVGVGTMGGRMAGNLLDAGYDLVVHDADESAAAAVAESGATAVGTPAEVAETAEVILTCLPDGDDVRDVALGEDGFVEAMGDGQVLIDTSTVGAAAIREVADGLAEAGAETLDAPISGGPTRAEEGTLRLVVGGDADVLAACRPILDAVAGRVTHVGDLGAGQVAKLANNMITGFTLAGVAEALVFVEKAGVDRATVVDAIEGGPAWGWVLENRAEWMIEEHFEEVTFRGDYQYKDLRLAIRDAQEYGAPIPITSAAHEVFKALAQSGRGDLDTAAVITVLEEMAGIYEE